MLLFTSLSTAVYSSCALALTALVRLLFSTVFLSLLVSSLWMVSAEIHSLWWVFFLPRTSSHVSCQSFLQCSHCVSMSVLLSSISSCSGWNLLKRLIWKAACVLVSEQSNIVLCLCAVGGGESLEVEFYCCHKKVVV